MGCIYSILNKVNGKIYVGLSVNHQKRKNEHIRKLNRGVHENPHLQKTWNKYGADAFEFNILENCSDDKLSDNEIWWINYFDSTNCDKGYNMESGGNSRYTVSEETRAKFIGENNPMYGKCGELAPNYGKLVSDETKQKIREARLGSSEIEEWGGLWFLKTMASTGITREELGRWIEMSGDAIESYLNHRGTSWRDISPNHCTVPNKNRQILLDLGGLDFLKECISNGMTQKEISSKYKLGTKGVIYRYLKSLGYSWKSLVDEVNTNG